MGTRGYRVYRHRGWYHIHYNHRDSYPEGLGWDMASEVPTGNPEAYRKWLESLRALLDTKLEENPDGLQYDDEEDYQIMRQMVPTTPFEWVYELDLDHEVFLVDSKPLFDLSAMPDSRELFLESIGYDNYGHRSYSQTTPEKHRYNWKSAPPAVPDSAIVDYAASEQDSELSVTELLGVAGAMGRCQTARTQLYELLIGSLMSYSTLGHDLRRLEAIPDRSHIPDAFLSFGVEMIGMTVGRMLLGGKLPPKIPFSEFTWLTSDICLYITTHLDDERNRKRDILKLVDEIVRVRPHRVAVGYGILFSFFHCVLVAVDPNNAFKCTPSLQFLPSFYATSTSTPGLTAVAALAYHSLVANFKTSDMASSLPSDHILNRVPEDIQYSIAENLSPKDLSSFTSILGPQFAAAAEGVLRYPHVGDYRLVGAVPPDDERSKFALEGKPKNYLGDPALVRRRFYAVCDGSLVPILSIYAEQPRNSEVTDGVVVHRLVYNAGRLGAVSFFSSSYGPFL
ncbi:hypothetical protein C8J57DRAFT_1282297 [Mycena rebaudengoi]|nr:hypothetical protein C8J57DRAFT_1282297 [Mycena rebaudengoi]